MPVVLHIDIENFEIQNLDRNADLDTPIVAINQNGMILSATESARELPGIVCRSTFPEDHRRRFPFLRVLQVANNTWGKPDSRSKRISGHQIQKVIIEVAKANKDKDRVEAVVEINSLDDMYVDVTERVAQIKRMEPQMLKVLLTDAIDGKWWEVGKQKRLDLCNSILELIRDAEASEESSSQMRSFRELSDMLYGALVASVWSTEILNVTGFQVSIGVSTSKSLARVATGFHPLGITMMVSWGFFKFALEVDASKVKGMDGDRGADLIDHLGGKMTISQLQKLDPDLLSRFLGSELASQVKGRAEGVDDIPLQLKKAPDSVSCGVTLEYPSSCYGYVRDELVKMLEEIKEMMLEEEHKFRDRLATRLYLELEPRPRNIQSSSFCCPIETQGWQGMDVSQVAESMLKGLRKNGYRLGWSSARRIYLTADEFVDINPQLVAFTFHNSS